jgi:ABC-type branched-subunit amino acid transport system substrate-binding protein
VLYYLCLYVLTKLTQKDFTKPASRHINSLKNLLLATLSLQLCLRAQAPVAKPLKVAVFAPVYLDSVFTGDAYKLGKANLPRYILSGLDFYNGAMLAVDSLNKEKAPVEVLFYDSKSAGGLEQQLADTVMQDVSLIIASFNNRDEIKPLADFALVKKIILISATYPNDGGIKENTSFVLINPTLTAHIEGIV